MTPRFVVWCSTSSVVGQIQEQNVARTICTDFARPYEPCSCGVLPRTAEQLLMRDEEKRTKTSFLLVGAVGIEPTTSPV